LADGTEGARATEVLAQRVVKSTDEANFAVMFALAQIWHQNIFMLQLAMSSFKGC
jgi:hypothetical protein